MTSKVQQAKEAQGYIVGAACCKACSHYRCDLVEQPGNRWTAPYYIEKNKRCGIGGFAVQSTGHCRLFERGSGAMRVAA